MITEKEKADLCLYRQDFGELNLHQQYFIAQLQLLSELIDLIITSDIPNRLKSLGQLLVSLVPNGKAIITLVGGAFIPEAHIIARSFLEKSVNYCYLNICDQCEYDNYLDWTEQKIIRALYTKQKTFKNVGQDVPLPDINSLTIKGGEKVKKFSGKKGGEKFTWTNISLYHRIKFLENVIGEKSLGMYLATMNLIYEDASENIHGTLYGATYHKIMFYRANISEEDKIKTQLSTMCDLYLFLGYLIHGIFQITAIKIPSDHIVEKSRENLNKAFVARKSLKDSTG